MRQPQPVLLLFNRLKKMRAVTNGCRYTRLRIILGAVVIVALLGNTGLLLRTISHDTNNLPELTSYNRKEAPLSPHALKEKLALLDYYFRRYSREKPSPYIEYLTGLDYSPGIFRSASSPPVLWLDEYGDVRWNAAAEREIYLYLAAKQTLDDNMSADEIVDQCLQSRLFVVHQDDWGFFSRYHCFIEQFGQSLYSPWMSLLSYKKFRHNFGHSEDFLDEGMLRYIEPISTCNKYLRHPRMKPIRRLLEYRISTGLHNIVELDQLLYKNQLQTNQTYFRINKKKVWWFGYDHVPFRRWVFSYKRFTPTYNLSTELLINHTDEHLYKFPLLTDADVQEWTPRNRPVLQTTKHLPGPLYKLTWQDHLFTGFLRYVFVLYFHRFAPRIHQLAHLLAEHWSSYLLDKSKRLLNNMAAIQIRRTDKKREDSFWRKHRYWRNISMYVKAIVDEEQRRNQTFSCLFVMSDDASVIRSIQDYSQPQSQGKDEPYAREHLKNRHILYNIFASGDSADSYSRTGLDQFLASIQFIINRAQFTVSHKDSNVARYLEEIIYSRNQLNPSVHTDSFVKSAPDSLE